MSECVCTVLYSMYCTYGCSLPAGGVEDRSRSLLRSCHRGRGRLAGPRKCAQKVGEKAKPHFRGYFRRSARAHRPGDSCSPYSPSLRTVLLYCAPEAA